MYSTQQGVFIRNTFSNYVSCKRTTYRMVEKFRTTASKLNKTQSLHRLTVRSGVSKSSARSTTKLLKLWPYTVIPRLTSSWLTSFAPRPEPDPDSLRTESRRFQSLLRGLAGLTEAGIEVLKDSALNEQPTATTRQGIMRTLPMRRFWGRRCLCLAKLQCLISSSHLQALVHRHLHCWTLDTMIQMTRLQFKDEMPSP
jgi:hypothetical protein